MRNKLLALLLSGFIIGNVSAPLSAGAVSADQKILFKEDFAGEAGSDFMQYDENREENDYFTGGFLIEGTATPWRDGRFEIIDDGQGRAIKRSYDTGVLSNVLQRPTRNLKNALSLNPDEQTVYYIKWKQYMGENDAFETMQIPASGAAVNFDALMLDLGMRAGAGFAADSEGKTVPFISYYTGEENIVFGTDEIVRGEWYNMILKIEANPDTPDKMSLAVYPADEEFRGEYRLAKEYTSSIAYSKVSYHFRACASYEQKADMAIGSVICEAYGKEETAAEEITDRAKQSVYENSTEAEADLAAASEKINALPDGILKTILSEEEKELYTRYSIYQKLNSFESNLDVQDYEAAQSIAEDASEQYRDEYFDIIGRYKSLYDALLGMPEAKNINVCYEDFAYAANTPVRDIPQLNEADTEKGFLSGWRVGSKPDMNTSGIIENRAVIVTDHKTISIPGNSSNYYMRRLGQPIEADCDDCYYITWVMRGFIPTAAGTQSQKLEIGTADGTGTPIMLGMIHQNGSDKLIPFIKVNNIGIAYGSQSIEEDKLYRFTAKLQMSGDKDLLALKVSDADGLPAVKWDASISAALTPSLSDRLDFMCNYGDGSKTVEYGDLKIQRYSKESMDLFEEISAELAKAEVDYNEQMLTDIKNKASGIEGICKDELNQRIRALENNIENEKKTLAELDRMIAEAESADISENNYDEIKSVCETAAELVNSLHSEEEKQKYLERINAVYTKLYYVQILKTSITDDFSKYEIGQPLSGDWFLDKELVQSAQNITALNGSVWFKENDAFRKIPPVDLNLYTWYMSILYEGTDAGFQIGDMTVSVGNDKILCKKENETVCEADFKTDGVLFFETDDKGIFIRNSDEEVYVQYAAEQTDRFGVLMGSVIKKITCQNVRRFINDDIRNAAEAAKSLGYNDISYAKSKIDGLGDTIIHDVYSQKINCLLEENKKLVPKITSISVSGSEYPGGELKVSYVMEDKGQNKAQPQIEWKSTAKTVSGTDTFTIPADGSGTVEVTVTPKNIFGVTGNPVSKSVSIKGTGSSSGGSGGGGGTSPSINKPAVTERPSAEPEYIFLDISNHWAKDNIEKLYKQGIVNGVENEFFCPDRSVTRAEFAMMISKIITEKNNSPVQFLDVTREDWFYEAVAKTAKCEIMVGDGTSFNPNREITREEIAVASYNLFKYLNCSSEAGAAVVFEDNAQISQWAKAAVDNCSRIRLMSGMDNNYFMPKKSATRAEAATIICRILNCY